MDNEALELKELYDKAVATLTEASKLGDLRERTMAVMDFRVALFGEQSPFPQTQLAKEVKKRLLLLCVYVIRGDNFDKEIAFKNGVAKFEPMEWGEPNPSQSTTQGIQSYE